MTESAISVPVRNAGTTTSRELSDMHTAPPSSLAGGAEPGLSSLITSLAGASYRARMKHVTFADKAVLMGDAAADTLLEYARVIAETSGADSVTLQAISPDGNTVDASFLLNANTILMVESTNSEVEPPENADAVREMRDRINAISQPPTADAATPWQTADYDLTEGI